MYQFDWLQIFDKRKNEKQQNLGRSVRYDDSRRRSLSGFSAVDAFSR